MIILDCVQGEQEWLDARKAKPTSSCFSKIITSSGRLSSQWFGYMNKLLAEHIDPSNTEKRFKSKSMEDGNRLEPASRKLYEQITNNIVTEVGGIWFDDKKEMLCSPDGLIHSKRKGFEVKNPNLDTHIGYVRKGVLPTIYTIQVQTGLAFSDFETWDFMSCHKKYKPLIITVERDEQLIKKIKESALYLSEQLKKEKAIIDKYTKLGF